MYRTLTALSALMLVVAFNSAASAQGFSAVGFGGQPNPWLQAQGGQNRSTPYYGPQVGTLPNGVPVHNPWLRYRGVQPIVSSNAFNYSVNYNTLSVLNPSLYPAQSLNSYYQYAYSNYLYNQYVSSNNLYNSWNNFNSYNNSNSWGYYPQYEREVGSFVSVNPQLAVNPFSGTVLNPLRGVAATREGYFYRVPGTGSFSPWGNYIPGSGVYVNPFTGAAYNPLTGIIAR